MGNGFITIVLMLGIFYFFLIRPEQTKQKKFKEMMNNLKVGDVILTRGGIHGDITQIEDAYVIIATGPDRVKIKVSRQGIGSVIETASVVEESNPVVEESDPVQSEVATEISLDKKNESSEE